MEKKVLIKEALMLHVDKDCWREELRAPFIQGDWVYATDSHTCIRIKCDIAGNDYPKKENDTYYPNAEKIFSGADMLYGCITDFSMRPSDGEDVLFENKVLRHDIYERVRDTMFMLGIEGYMVRTFKGDNTAILFQNGDVEIIVMPIIGKARIPVKCDNEIFSYGINYEAGMAYCKQRKKVIEEAEAKRAQELKNNIFCVTIARYASMYVEALTPEEAMKIAEENIDEVDDTDFDDSAIDSCDASASDAQDYMETIYTAEGSFTYDEYMDYIED